MLLMSRLRFLSVFCILLLLCQPSVSVLEWLFGTDESDNAKPAGDGEADESSIRFEVLSSDEKFLDFAQTLADLSPLDTCYNIVIYSLKKRCGDLSEEELGKLSVQLLNCQSEAEDRPVYLCTASMNLADCTKSMDGTTWNSYQIVGNRARAMCYANQQLQFRRLTEQTVNRLVMVTTNQVKSLSDLKDGQDQLHSLTAETVRKLYESQQDLLSTQHTLRDAHQEVFRHIAGNVKEIMQEKALIASGNKELAAMTQNIREKLELTADEIKQRESVEHEKHEKIIKDLKDIQDNTETSVQKLDVNLRKLLLKYTELDTQYEGLSDNLKRMNATISYLMNSVTYMQTHFDDRITWISQMLGGADDKLSAMSCCLLHIAYFFMLAVTATFLQISVPVRLAMMVVIVGNVAAELNYDHSLDFAGLTVFLTTLYGGFKLIVYIGKRFGRYQSYQTNGSGTPYGANLSPEELRTLLNLLQRFTQTVSDTGTTGVPPPTSNGAATAIRDFSFPGPTPRYTDSEPPTPPSTSNSSLNNSTRLFNASTISQIEDPLQQMRNSLNPLSTLSGLGMRGSVGPGGSQSSSRASTPIPRESSTPSP